LQVLKEKLDETGGVLELPLIINRKTVDPRDKSSPPVIQLESAMGAAIGSFKDAQLLCVPRARFVPVKTTDDLLVLRSDVYTLSDDLVVSAVPERVGKLPYVELDPDFYKLLDDFEKRFPGGAPSLRAADRFVVHGDVTFEEGVRVCGAVELDVDEPTRIAAGTTLEP
jgi:UTP--glucose-1-phosphate uridylyltransferase